MTPGRRLLFALCIAAAVSAALTIDCIVCQYGIDSKAGGGEGRCEEKYDFNMLVRNASGCDVCVLQTSVVYFHMEYTYRNCWSYDEIPEWDNVNADNFTNVAPGNQVCVDVGDDPNIAIRRCYCMTGDDQDACNSGFRLNPSKALFASVLSILLLKYH